MNTAPGYYRGLHYTAYIDDVKKLKAKRDYATAERLLLELVKAVEGEARVNQWAVAPAYYEQLAIIYRKQKDSKKGDCYTRTLLAATPRTVEPLSCI